MYDETWSDDFIPGQVDDNWRVTYKLSTSTSEMGDDWVEYEEDGSVKVLLSGCVSGHYFKSYE